MNRILTGALLLTLLPMSVLAAEPIKIGAVMSLTEIPEFTQVGLATAKTIVKDINDKGGLLGRPLELIVQDDRGEASTAIQVAESLKLKDKADFLVALSMDHISVALSDFAAREKTFLLSVWGTDDDMTWKNGNKYTFVIESTPSVQAKKFAMSAAAPPAKRWAFIGTNDVLGRGYITNLKKEIKKLRPDAEFVIEQYPAWGELTSSHILALKNAKPDAVFAGLYSDDLIKFIREGQKRQFLNDKLYQQYIAMGWYQDADSLGDQAPQGVYSSGCPGNLPMKQDKELIAKILKATGKKHLGCVEIQTIVLFEFLQKTIEKAGGTDNVKMANALEGMKVETPFGPVSMRTIDHRSTLGYWHGKMGMVDGLPRLVDYTQADVNALSPSDDWIKAQRKAR